VFPGPQDRGGRDEGKEAGRVFSLAGEFMDELFFVGKAGAWDVVLPQGTAEDGVFREEEGGFGVSAVVPGTIFGSEK
jgi:hypothetical protein